MQLWKVCKRRVTRTKRRLPNKSKTLACIIIRILITTVKRYLWISSLRLREGSLFKKIAERLLGNFKGQSLNSIDEYERQPAPLITRRLSNPISSGAVQTQTEMYSTTRLGRIIGVEAKPILFDVLLNEGFITKNDGHYRLTSKGASITFGGKYHQSKDGEEFVVWPLQFGSIHKNLKQRILDSMEFRLFHIVHINNLASIVEMGLFSHNSAPSYVDISNPDVNAQRSRKERIHNAPLHDYVPLYFNPRNAMLFAAQKNFPSKIVILEVNQRACLSNYVIFSERNAVAERAKFVYCLSQLQNFNWKEISEREWHVGGISYPDTKQLMMSECLIRGHVDSQNLSAIHVADTNMKLMIQSLLKEMHCPEIKCSPSLFF